MKIINGIRRFVKWIFNIGLPNEWPTFNNLHRDSFPVDSEQRFVDRLAAQNERDSLRRDTRQVITQRQVEDLNAQLAESIRIVEEANNVISIETVQATTQQHARRAFDLNFIHRSGGIHPINNSITYQRRAPVEILAGPSPQFQVPNMIMGSISPNLQPSITAEQMQIRFGYNPQNSMDSLSPPAKQGDPEEPLGLSIYQQSIENENRNEKNTLTNNHYDLDNITV